MKIFLKRDYLDNHHKKKTVYTYLITMRNISSFENKKYFF